MLIRHANLITWDKPNSILAEQAVLIRGGVIRAIGADSELHELIQTKNVLMRIANILCLGIFVRTPIFMGLFRGDVYIPGRPAKDFPEILDKLWWPLDRALTLEDVRYSALVCLVDAVRHGTTTLIDHHASPNAIDGSLDVIAEAVEEAGVRAGLCYEVTDRDGAGSG